MKKLRWITGAAVLGILICSGDLAVGQSKKFDVPEFVKTVLCELANMPLGSCDLLDPNVYKAIQKAKWGILSNRYCGTGQINAAKGMLELGHAPNPQKCAALVGAYEAYKKQ